MNYEANKIFKTAVAVVGVISFIGLVILLAYLLMAGLTYLVCLGFGLAWNWYIPLGVYAAALIAKIFFFPSKKDKE